MKNLFFVFLMMIIFLTSCATPRSKTSRGLLASLRKTNDNLNQKVEKLEDEIKLLISSKEIDVPKAELLKKVQLLEKERDVAHGKVQKKDQDIRMIESGNKRLELELIDAKNESMMLKKNNADLNALLAKLTDRIKSITKKESAVLEATPGEGKEKPTSKEAPKEKKVSEKGKPTKELPTDVKAKKASSAKKDKKTDEKKQKIAKKEGAVKPKETAKDASPTTKSTKTVASKKQSPKPKPVVVADKSKPKKKVTKSPEKSKASSTPVAKKKDAIKAKIKKTSKVAAKSTAAKTKSPAPTTKTTVKKGTKKTPEPSKVKSTKSAPSNEIVVLEFVAQWKDVWEKKDIKTYIGFYSAKFKGRGMNLKAWNKYKTKNFRSKKNINLKISKIKTKKKNNNEIVVKFIQDYQADRYSDIGVKTLHWVKEKGGWKITRESWKRKK